MLCIVSAEQLDLNLPIVIVTYYITPRFHHIIIGLIDTMIDRSPTCSQFEENTLSKCRKIPKHISQGLRKFSQPKLINEES